MAQNSPSVLVFLFGPNRHLTLSHSIFFLAFCFWPLTYLSSNFWSFVFKISLHFFLVNFHRNLFYFIFGFLLQFYIRLRFWQSFMFTVSQRNIWVCFQWSQRNLWSQNSWKRALKHFLRTHFDLHQPCLLPWRGPNFLCFQWFLFPFSPG